MAAKRSQKKDFAKLLYIKESLTQKEIAEKVGITEKTLSLWINKENWSQLKTSLVITKEEELRRIYIQINEINNSIETRENGQKFSSPKEADTISKLAAAARAMESDASLSDVIEVFKRFINWMRAIDLDKAKEIIVYQDAFIKTLLK